MKGGLLIVGFLATFVTSYALAQVNDESPDRISLNENVYQTPKEVLSDALAQTETQACFEMTDFLQNVVFKDLSFKKAAQTRNARDVSAVAEKYAVAAAHDLNADYFFYMPNARFFVRVNDKNYRGRMRLPSTVASSFSACYWENLPSGDVAYSALTRIDDTFPGYVKLSKTLPQMAVNLPDMMSSVGKVRVYTAVDKGNFRKRDWGKMRKNEPNKPEEFCWCSGEALSFLSTVGNGAELPQKAVRSVLAAIDGEKPFVVGEAREQGDALIIKTVDGLRLGAIAFVLKTP